MVLEAQRTTLLWKKMYSVQRARFARMGDGYKRASRNDLHSSGIPNVLEKEGGGQKWQERAATWQTQVGRTSLLLSFSRHHSVERQTLPANAQAYSRAIFQCFASSWIPSGAITTAKVSLHT